MPLANPIPVRLLPAQLRWLDDQIRGPITTRSEALRHALTRVMVAEARAQQQPPSPADQ